MHGDSKWPAVAAAMYLVVCSLAHAAPQLATGDGLEPLPDDTRPIRYRIMATPYAESGRFAANAELAFEVLKPTRQVVVNALELEIASARLAGGGMARVVPDHARQRITFEFAQPLNPGKHTIEVSYSGRINDNVGGVFKVDYPMPGGVTKQMLFTHLCCIGAARRFAPIWDQPDLKAEFELQLIIPQALDAFSNMPIAAREEIAGGRARVRFAPTPRMSSYLLFFAIGEFERLTRMVGPTELGVVVQEGKAERGRFALNATADALKTYNDYFAMPYPLPKLDAIGMPGSGGFGAMENWGAIFYFEPYIAIDPRLSTERDRQFVYEIVAHEVSHQWFGNLVTMRWWDDLWLNEGFAVWMALKTSDRFHPEWNMWLHAADNREKAMSLDASSTTHPIIREVKTLEEAELAFDDITYEKGGQVIRMIEGWIGEEAFRTAIRAHIRKHAYGNATTADLMREFEHATSLPVIDVVRDFTEQAGVPMIEVHSTTCEAGASRTTVTLTQGRFGLDEVSRSPRLWNVPVTAKLVGGKEVVRRIVRGDEPVRLELAGCGPVKINVGETGYFRTRYDSQSFAGLRAAFARLPAADQLGLLKDSRGLAEGGYVSLQTYLDLADSLDLNADPLLLLDHVRAIRDLDRLYRGLPSQRDFRTYARGQFGPMLARIGWIPAAQERENTGILREELIGLLARMGDEATIAKATGWFKRGDSDPAAPPAAIRKAVVGAVGAGADEMTFADLKSRAIHAVDSAEKGLYLISLAGANDPMIANKALELALSDAVPRPMVETIFQTVAERHPEQAFDFAAAHYDEVASRSGPYAPFVMTAIAGNVVDARFSERFSAFASERLGKEASESVERAMAVILRRSRLRDGALKQVDDWLKRRPAPI